MRLKIFTLIAISLFFSKNTLASYDITTKNLQSHVDYLSSDKLEGRLTGSKGEKLATDYIANYFHQLGLIPAGDNDTFFQTFDFISGVSLGKNNSLLFYNQNGQIQKLALGRDWRPLSFSDNGSFEIKTLVVVGAGDAASYRHLNVKNKWVVVFSGVSTLLRYKAFTAKAHGAKGIIFVNKTAGNDLIPFSLDTSLSGSGIIALSINKKFLNDLLNKNIKLAGQTDIKKNKQQGRNVLAKLSVGPNVSKMMVVGAHVDHLGRGELSGSRATNHEVGMIHAGADDNASGVASMLEAAAKLSDLKAKNKLSGNKDILFAAWSGEEYGVLGSSHFVSHFKHSNDRPVIAINLDMVGHLRENLVLQGVGSSNDWLSIIKRVEKSHSISLITQRDPYLPTDSTPFYLQGVPTLNFFTGAHENYHTPRDKPETLNYQGIKYVSDFLVDFILALEDKKHLINFQAVPKTIEHAKRDFKIYLGTIPDYASADISGVKLSGVAKNSPAEMAGMKQDDIVVELAGKSIHDIYDYTFMINKLPVDKAVKIIVLRGKLRVPLMVVARYR